MPALPKWKKREKQTPLQKAHAGKTDTDMQ